MTLTGRRAVAMGGATLALVLAACGADSPTAIPPSASASQAASSTVPSDVTTPDARTTPVDGGTGPAQPGETAWVELWSQGTGTPTARDPDPDNGEIHEGHVFRGGTLAAGETVFLELPDFHAFADAPRAGRVVVTSDDTTQSEVLLVDMASGERQTVLTTEDIIWGATISPRSDQIFFVPVDRESMTDSGVWRLALDGDAEPAQLTDPLADRPYDFASLLAFAWSPAADRFVAQHCNREACQAQIVDPQSGETLDHDQPGVFHLRGMTDDDYIADAISRGQRSGLLAVDLDTLDVQVLTDEWGVADVIQTHEGPMVVYLSPDPPARAVVLVGLWVDKRSGPFTVYEERDTDTPSEFHTRPGDAHYEAPPGQMLLWPGPPGPEGPATWEPEFLLFDVLEGDGERFAYEFNPPR